jgi:hypothetical protein
MTRVSKQQDEKIDATVHLLAVLTPEQRLQIADSRLSDHADAYPDDDQKDIPRPLVALRNGRFQPANDCVRQPFEKSADQRHVSRVAQTDGPREALELELQTDDCGEPCSRDEIGIWRFASFVPTHRSLRHTGRDSDARLAQPGSQPRVLELVGVQPDEPPSARSADRGQAFLGWHGG